DLDVARERGDRGAEFVADPVSVNAHRPASEESHMQSHKTVSRDEWLAARRALLAEEKAFTRARDELSRKRRDLPWVKVEKRYVFDGPRGKETLADLFGGNSQ